MKDQITEVKKLLKTDKLVIGTTRTLKFLKQGKLQRIFITTNCPENIRKDFENYSKISNVEVVSISLPNDELGIICKKPFPISVLGLLK